MSQSTYGRVGQLKGNSVEKLQYVLDDQYEVTNILHEMRMSLWGYSLVIVERSMQRLVLDLSGSLWDLRQ